MSRIIDLRIMYWGILSLSLRPQTVESEASDCGKRVDSQSENLADIDWNCLLSKMPYFRIATDIKLLDASF